MEEPDEETDAEGQHQYNGGGPLQPELFFKMSHDIYNYGEGLMGKIAAERSHKWIFRDPPAHENVNLLPSSWQAPADSYPRTWEAQFKAGIQTIAVIAVGEGLLQLGSTKKILQDVDFVLMLQRKFNYLHSIPGLFAQTRANMSVTGMQMEAELQAAGHNVKSQHFSGLKRIVEQTDGLEANSSLPLNLNPSPLPSVTAQPFPTQTLPVDVPFMYNSLQALLSKLPAVTPAGPANADDVLSSPPVVPAAVHGMLWPPTLRGRVSSAHSTSAMNTQPIMPSSSSSTTAGLPIHSTEDFESYHCLFGPTLS
ncbi:hypothetical protein KP509_11G075900 [Ceratopteris richardii]|nr:hypothetical protein KP509_11G075900 [Ceratopteris richardii]